MKPEPTLPCTIQNKPLGRWGNIWELLTHVVYSLWVWIACLLFYHLHRSSKTNCSRTGEISRKAGYLLCPGLSSFQAWDTGCLQITCSSQECCHSGLKWKDCLMEVDASSASMWWGRVTDYLGEKKSRRKSKPCNCSDIYTQYLTLVLFISRCLNRWRWAAVLSVRKG